jgi:hypothetical protein
VDGGVTLAGHLRTCDKARDGSSCGNCEELGGVPRSYVLLSGNSLSSDGRMSAGLSRFRSMPGYVSALSPIVSLTAFRPYFEWSHLGLCTHRIHFREVGSEELVWRV